MLPLPALHHPLLSLRHQNGQIEVRARLQTGLRGHQLIEPAGESRFTPRRRLDTIVLLAGWQTVHVSKRMLIKGRFSAECRATRETPSYGNSAEKNS